MPVGHERINAREQDPNPNITFIRSLPEYPNHEQALHLLKSLAAQFKPIMKEWGFGVNSLVEYEPNDTFAGRNWNGGEVIEIVLRRKTGEFLPWNFLLYVMCHELAHIREMSKPFVFDFNFNSLPNLLVANTLLTSSSGVDHSHYFQNVNKQIRQALSTLRQKGYTGDGFYGTGRTLIPDYQGNDARLATDEIPTYTCGGALKKVRRRRPRVPNPDSTSKPRRARGSAVTLGTTGRQTALKKKAGGRVTKKLPGKGHVLGAKDEEEESDDEGEVMSTKGLRTQSKASRAAREIAATSRLEAEKRAKAIEARLNGGGGGATQVKPEELDDGDDDWEFEEESDEDNPDIKQVEKRMGKKEKDYLKDDLRDWEQEVDDQGVLTEADKKILEKLKRKFGEAEKEDSDDDDVIIVEQPVASTSTASSTQNKKKVKVCRCKLPKAFIGGGVGKKKIVGKPLIPDMEEEWTDEE
ncbi:hypothetical protein JCM3765_004173 [Sporobolomyces pararoseus]